MVEALPCRREATFDRFSEDDEPVPTHPGAGFFFPLTAISLPSRAPIRYARDNRSPPRDLVPTEGDPMLSIRRVLFVAMLAAFGLSLSGCGPKYPETFPVAGTVTLDGKPVAGAAVVFTPEEGQQATGTTDDSGRFELSTFQLGDGALPGTHRVTVAKTTTDPDDEVKLIFIIPQKYGNLQTSDLTCDVQAEMGPVQYDLQPESIPEPNPETTAEPDFKPISDPSSEPSTDEPADPPASGETPATGPNEE